MHRVILPLIVLLSLAFAPAPLPKNPRAQQRTDDLARLQGEWLEVRTRIGDLNCSVGDHVMVVSGRALSHVIRGKVSITWYIDPDPRHVPPRLNQRRQGDGYLLLSIYRLEGDTLTVSWQNENDAAGWPVDFKGGQGIGVSSYRRKR
jgi:hypothetical protein